MSHPLSARLNFWWKTRERERDPETERERERKRPIEREPERENYERRGVLGGDSTHEGSGREVVDEVRGGESI